MRHRPLCSTLSDRSFVSTAALALVVGAASFCVRADAQEEPVAETSDAVATEALATEAQAREQPAELAPIEYHLDLSNRVHHEALVTVIWRDLPPGPLEVRMSRSSPGRYRLHEFAKNVSAVEAETADGAPLEVLNEGPHGWLVPYHEGTVLLRYTLYGDQIDGTYTAIDRTHAHLNMPATFAWAAGLEERPIELLVDLPDPDWSVATQLAPTDQPHRFRAHDLQYFLDSPTEIGPLEWSSWSAGENGRQAEFRFAIHHQGTAEDAALYVTNLRALVAETTAVWGELPRFDYGTYTFFADYLPWARGDAMEHRNSTPLTSPRPLATSATDLIATAVHEFFHAWNVERLRPADLEPFDFARLESSEALWFAEGFTNHYTGLILTRAGLWSHQRYAANLSNVINTMAKSPAPRVSSPRLASQQAAFFDRGVWADPTNRHNTYLHYYSWGDALGLWLDLKLRLERELTLDDWMASLWRAYGDPEIPYTLGDLRASLVEFAGASLADDFFRRSIDGGEAPDFDGLLEPFGFALTQQNPDRAWLGHATLSFGMTGALLDSGTTHGSPLYVADLDRGDAILRLADRELKHRADLEEVLATHEPGDVVEALVRFRDGEERRVSITTAADPTLSVRRFEDLGRAVTGEVSARRNAWLGSRADN